MNKSQSVKQVQPKNQKVAIKSKKNKNQSTKDVISKYNQLPRDDILSNKFFNALSCPFDPKNIGCTVPDPFPFATVSYHIHQTSVISNATGFTNGAVCFLPNPVLSMLDSFGVSNVGGNVNKCVTTTPFVQYATTDYRADLYGATSVASLASIFSTYRVVSWGIKISNLQPELSATGRIIISQIPIGDTVPSYNLLSGTALSGNSLNTLFGMPLSLLNSSSTLELPTAIELAVQDLLHGDMEISGMYTNSLFWSFKSTSTYGSNGTQVFGDEVLYNVTGGTSSSIGYKDDTRCVGGCGINIYFEGFPSGSLGFQVETIYHLEGSPVISTGINNIPVPSNKQTVVIGSTTSVEKAMSKASIIDNVYEFIGKGTSFLNDNKDTIARGASLLSKFI